MKWKPIAPVSPRTLSVVIMDLKFEIFFKKSIHIPQKLCEIY